MILTNLHMVDIPYARKVSCARESKVIEVTHTLLHLSLAHMDELDSRACICASFCKVLCSPHNCLPAHHSGHHSSLRSPPDAIYCPFAMGGCKLVVGDGEVDVLLAKGNRQHGDAIEEESLLEMLCSTVREEMKVVHCWILDHQQLQYLDDGDHGHVLVVVHVVSDHHERVRFSFDPGAGCEQGDLKMPPMSTLHFVLLLNFSVFREVKLEEQMVVLGADSESVELHLLVLFDEHVHLEGLQLGVELLDDFKQGNLPFLTFRNLSLSS